MKPGTLPTQARYWLPALAAGAGAWAVFMILGGTPLIRAGGLALVIVAMALALRPMGAVLSIIGAFALAFCPAFWIQTGGAESLSPPAVFAGLAAALFLVGIAWAVSRKPFIALALGLVVFGALFLALIGQPRSLRLTTLASAWTFYLLIDGLLLSNPRPDSPPTGALGTRHTVGLLLLMTLGILNDPLFVLLAPAALLGLFLSRARLHWAFWTIMLILMAIGIRGVIALYIDPDWVRFDPQTAEMLRLRVPYILAEAWREPSRWLKLTDLLIGQFTPFGLALGVLGLARLSRWYPPIGVVTMFAYGSFALFGLVYFGADSPVLLLPLLMIQVFWMTYAIYTFSQWMAKTSAGRRVVDRPSLAPAARWIAPAAFILMPLAMLARIAGLLG